MNGIRERILKYITNHHKKYGYAPSMREIAKHTNRSVGGTHKTLNAMEKDRLIVRDSRIPRSIRVR